MKRGVEAGDLHDIRQAPLACLDHARSPRAGARDPKVPAGAEFVEHRRRDRLRLGEVRSAVDDAMPDGSQSLEIESFVEKIEQDLRRTRQIGGYDGLWNVGVATRRAA